MANSSSRESSIRQLTDSIYNLALQIDPEQEELRLSKFYRGFQDGLVGYSERLEAEGIVLSDELVGLFVFLQAFPEEVQAQAGTVLTELGEALKREVQLEFKYLSGEVLLGGFPLTTFKPKETNFEGISEIPEVEQQLTQDQRLAMMILMNLPEGVWISFDEIYTALRGEEYLERFVHEVHTVMFKLQTQLEKLPRLLDGSPFLKLADEMDELAPGAFNGFRRHRYQLQSPFVIKQQLSARQPELH